MKRVAVLTSGGDAPGMNAAVRAVVRVGIDIGLEVLGVRDGFAGVLAGAFRPLGPRHVGGIIQRGGTILGSTRCSEFKDEKVRLRALSVLRQQQIDGLVVIGGNGSQAGSQALSVMGFPVVGVASTIDNDVFGSEVSIGVDTALNIALEAIDRLKTTASSHRRVFLVEVMGRNCGYLALVAGLAGGAEVIVLPEMEIDPETIACEVRAAYERGKAHAIVVVSEGARFNAQRLSCYFEEHQERLGFEMRVTTLGHVQRGGAPGVFDRLLATRLGEAAVRLLAEGKHGLLVGLCGGEISTTPLSEVVSNRKMLDSHLISLARVLSK